jgi:Lrp/AsnC family transcriptional regulator for asnA, asnC and gidA
MNENRSLPEDQLTRSLQPDDLDRQIIGMLQSDGRRSNREIARSLGVPDATVRYRIRRLCDTGLLRITALVDPEQLGYDLTAVISLQTDPQLVRDIAETVSKLPEVMCLVITTGDYAVTFTASFRDHDDLYRFITDQLSPIPGITRVNTAVGLEVVKRDYEWASELTAMLARTEDE